MYTKYKGSKFYKANKCVIKKNKIHIRYKLEKIGIKKK